MMAGTILSYVLRRLDIVQCVFCWQTIEEEVSADLNLENLRRAAAPPQTPWTCH